MIEAGKKFRAKATETNRRCGIKPEAACWITFVDARHISFFAEKGDSQGFIEAKAAREDFGMNFVADPFSGINAGYRETKHKTRIYPKDFFLL